MFAALHRDTSLARGWVSTRGTTHGTLFDRVNIRNLDVVMQQRFAKTPIHDYAPPGNKLIAMGIDGCTEIPKRRSNT